MTFVKIEKSDYLNFLNEIMEMHNNQYESFMNKLRQVFSEPFKPRYLFSMVTKLNSEDEIIKYLKSQFISRKYDNPAYDFIFDIFNEIESVKDEFHDIQCISQFEFTSVSVYIKKLAELTYLHSRLLYTNVYELNEYSKELFTFLNVIDRF